MVSPLDPFDVIRKWFQSFNAGDIERLAALYHEDATKDYGSEPAQGRDEIRKLLEQMLVRAPQRTVRMIARVETGAMHAEWRGTERNPENGEVATSAGYDDFIIDAGLIRDQRTVLHPLSFQAEEEVAAPSQMTRPSRQYPAQPIVGVGAVIM